jgi:hypothetical protein
MFQEDIVASLLKRIEDLGKRVPPNSKPLNQGKKPVNPAAYKTALRSWIGGNRKPLEAYLKVYRVPIS